MMQMNKMFFRQMTLVGLLTVMLFSGVDRNGFGKTVSASDDPADAETIFDYEEDIRQGRSPFRAYLDPDEFNGHVYQLFLSDAENYAAMEAFCEDLGGHLACIGSPEENEFLFDYLGWVGTDVCYFGLQCDENGSWSWVSGEPLEYINWNPAEPNGFEDGERYGDYMPETYPDGTWNDAYYIGDWCMFLCEWESWDDRYNGKNFYSIEELGDFDGHSYQLCYLPAFNWNEKEAWCNKVGGHMACIETYEVDSWLYEKIAPYDSAEISTGLFYRDDEWHWVNGAPVIYTHWAEDQPDLAGGYEYWGTYQPGVFGENWNDDDGLNGYFICEWDTLLASYPEENADDTFVPETRDEEETAPDETAPDETEEESVQEAAEEEETVTDAEDVSSTETEEETAPDATEEETASEAADEEEAVPEETEIEVEVLSGGKAVVDIWAAGCGIYKGREGYDGDSVLVDSNNRLVYRLGRMNKLKDKFVGGYGVIQKFEEDGTEKDIVIDTSGNVVYDLRTDGLDVVYYTDCLDVGYVLCMTKADPGAVETKHHYYAVDVRNGTCRPLEGDRVPMISDYPSEENPHGYQLEWEYRGAGEFYCRFYSGGSTWSANGPSRAWAYDLLTDQFTELRYTSSAFLPGDVYADATNEEEYYYSTYIGFDGETRKIYHGYTKIVSDTVSQIEVGILDADQGTYEIATAPLPENGLYDLIDEGSETWHVGLEYCKPIEQYSESTSEWYASAVLDYRTMHVTPISGYYEECVPYYQRKDGSYLLSLEPFEGDDEIAAVDAAGEWLFGPVSAEDYSTCTENFILFFSVDERKYSLYDWDGNLLLEWFGHYLLGDSTVLYEKRDTVQDIDGFEVSDVALFDIRTGESTDLDLRFYLEYDEMDSYQDGSYVIEHMNMDDRNASGDPYQSGGIIITESGVVHQLEAVEQS